MADSVDSRLRIDLARRSLAPDLARGVMLLAIASAHAPLFVHDWHVGPAALERAAEFFKYLALDNQARSMFVFLFGSGLGQFARRQRERGGGPTSLRRLLYRRGRWLVVIGFAHAAFMPLDIVSVYGLALLVLAPLVRARDAVLCWTGVATLVPATLLVSVTEMLERGAPATMAAAMAPDLGTHLATGIQAWPVKTVLAVVVVAPGMVLGIWAARREVLDEPERHARLLRGVAVVFVGASVIGRLPAALLLTGALTTSSEPLTWAVVVAHTATGYTGGIGMAAVVGLVAMRSGRERGRLTTALAALGQRSLTFYLFQSVVFLALFYPFAMDLREDMGITASYGVAVGTWVASVLLADGMRRAGHRGPAEVVVRRLTYR